MKENLLEEKNRRVTALSRDDELKGPLQARSDLVDILKFNPENTDAIVTIIQSELKGIKSRESKSKISKAVGEAAKEADVDPEVKDNVLYWLTETSPDARQLILVRTIEELLGIEESKKSTLDALAKVSSEENVDMVMEWVNKKIMTLNQAVYVLLFPDSSKAFE
jgi:hypothetical protein